jgi:nitrogen fixation NifU-like protein
MNAAEATMGDELAELFRATILDHARHPRNRGTNLTAPDIETHGVNASCGDRVSLRLCVDGSGMITAIEWEGQGCAISQASVSMMTRAVKGQPLAEAERVMKAFHQFLRSEHDPEAVPLGELQALAGVRRFPTRVKCASLGWDALAEGIAVAQARQKADDDPPAVRRVSE